jgi:hypothetical protein
MSTELSPLEQQILAIAERQGSVAELCRFIEYDTELGRVPGYFRPNVDVLLLVRALLAAQLSISSDTTEQSVPLVVNGHPLHIKIRRSATLRELAIRALQEAKVIDYDLYYWVLTTDTGEVLGQGDLVAHACHNTTIYIHRKAGIGG